MDHAVEKTGRMEAIREVKESDVIEWSTKERSGLADLDLDQVRHVDVGEE